MSENEKRKGATRVADIPAGILQALSRGELASANLTEVLALSQSRLLRAVFPALPPSALAAAESLDAQGIVKRMVGIAHLLLSEAQPATLQSCLAHPADTVRGWGCFMLGARSDLTLSERLAAIRPLADDAHFGVREWAWLAVRPRLIPELDLAIAELATWTASPSERIRRFASEALRPRGVWCAHIGELKRQPQRALAILSPLRADPSVYVQDSVANWLNDAGKDSPDWVQTLCARWLSESPSPATARICQRAMRNLAGASR